MNGHGNRIICVEVLQSSPCGAVEGDDGEMQPPVYSHDLFRCHCVSVNLPFDPLYINVAFVLSHIKLQHGHCPLPLHVHMFHKLHV